MRLMRRMRDDESGVAMIMVVGMAGIMLTFVTLIAVRSINNLGQVRSERLYEQTLHVADSGIDHTLFQLREDRNYSNEGALPNFSTAPDPEAAERAWVLAAADDNPLVTESDGQWQVVKPAGTAVIYAVGYVPTKTEADKIRILRAEYDFPPLLPQGALLTGGSLSINGGVTVGGANGSAHANGDGIVVGGSNAFSGNYTSSGTFSGGGLNVCTPAGEVPDCDPDAPHAGQPEQEVPDIDPRESWDRSEYDLCPDGSVKAGPSFTGSEVTKPDPVNDEPCSGGILSASGTYRGWSMSPQGWGYNSATNYDGVYYAYQSSVDVQGGGTLADPWDATILAEAVKTGGGNEADCTHSHDAGDIRITGNPKMISHSKGSPLLLIAGRDLTISGSAGAGGQQLEGVLAAHEQYNIGGTVQITGTVISNDFCDTTGSPEDENVVGGNVTVVYNAYEVPLGKRIRTTLWLEI